MIAVAGLPIRGAINVNDVVRYKLDDGSTILVEVSAPEGMRPAARPAEIAAAAAQSLQAALEPIEPLVRTVAARLRQLPESPDEVTVEFGVKLGAEAGIVLARAAVDAQLQLKLTWKSDAD
jgi:Trypsin-co-occurring domain 1